MPAPFTIAGSINLGQAPNLASGLSGYTSAYQQALNTAQQNYNNILSGYQQLMRQQITAQNALIPKYGQLQQQVLGDIQGVTASQSQAIRDTYAQQWGSTAQNLINAGLGNTTVQQSLQRGLTLDEQKAQVALANQQAQLTAGYRSQLGLAGLGYQANAIAANTALGNQQLQTMNSFQIPFPSPNPYMQMYAAQQARAGAGQGSFLSPPGNPYGHLMSAGRSSASGASYGGYGFGTFGTNILSDQGVGSNIYSDAGIVNSLNDMRAAGRAGADPMGAYGSQVYAEPEFASVGDWGAASGGAIGGGEFGELFD